MPIVLIKNAFVNHRPYTPPPSLQIEGFKQKQDCNHQYQDSWPPKYISFLIHMLDGIGKVDLRLPSSISNIGLLVSCVPQSYLQASTYSRVFCIASITCNNPKSSILGQYNWVYIGIQVQAVMFGFKSLKINSCKAVFFNLFKNACFIYLGWVTTVFLIYLSGLCRGLQNRKSSLNLRQLTCRWFSFGCLYISSNGYSAEYSAEQA